MLNLQIAFPEAAIDINAAQAYYGLSRFAHMRLFALLVLLGGLFASRAHAEDWTTTKGKTYRGITVLAHTNVTVTILYADGGATLNMIDLPPAVQKKYGMDRKAAEAQKAKDDAIAAQEAADLKAQQDAKAATDRANREANAAADAAIVKEKSDDQKRLDSLNAYAKANYDTADKAAVTGQVSILTREKETIPMASIHVRLYTEEQIRAALDMLTANGGNEDKKLQPTLDDEKSRATAKKSDDVIKAYRDTLGKFYYYSSQAYYADNLPAPVADSVTDADGKFTMSIPKTGSWALVAQGQHTKDNQTQGYLWITKMDPAAIAKNQVVLNDDNLTGPNSLMTGLSDSDIAALIQKKIDDLNPK